MAKSIFFVLFFIFANTPYLTADGNAGPESIELPVFDKMVVNPDGTATVVPVKTKTVPVKPISEPPKKSAKKPKKHRWKSGGGEPPE